MDKEERRKLFQPYSAASDALSEWKALRSDLMALAQATDEPFPSGEMDLIREYIDRNRGMISEKIHKEMGS